jgi:hypothetical protein
VHTDSHRKSHSFCKSTKTVRNATRRGVAESLMEERLQTGENKWRKGLFKERSEDTDSDQQMPDQKWRSDVPDKWDMIE